MPRYSNHRKVFLEHYGPAPWLCAECDELITGFGKTAGLGAVHHKNEDKFDNRPENLQILHFSCHRRLHMLGTKQDPAVSKKISESNMGHIVTDETRRKISEANTGNLYCLGRKYSDETIAKMRKSHSKTPKAVCECGLTTRLSSMVSHLKATRHNLVFNPHKIAEET